ncbi:MAG TPA: PKD domain-containing protein, partial [Anaerolineales bacterium]
MLKSGVKIALLFAFLFVALGAQAQTQEVRFLQPTASLSGNTGLWKIHTPVNLAPGQAAFSVWIDRINRNPGQLTITTIGFGGSVPLTSWLEFGANFEANRRVLVRRFEELSLGQQRLGFFGTQAPGATPFPSELMPDSTLFPQLRDPATPTGALSGAAGYYNMLPFANRIQGNGIGTATAGFKINALSEAKGNPVNLGFRTYAHIPTHRSAALLQSEPTQTGGWIFGTDLLVGKALGEMMDFNFNWGYRWLESPDNGNAIKLSDVMPVGIGVTLPRAARLQLMSELAADVLVGTRTPNTTPEADDVIDFTIGFRAFLNRYLNLSAGYRHPLNQSRGDKHGFVVQLGYTHGPAAAEVVASPPSLSCSVTPSEVEIGQVVSLTAQGSSSTGAALTYEWSTTGGTIEGSGQSVQVRTTGLAPGSYVATVRATEQPGLFADCSTRFTVVQPPPPPQPPTVSLTADRTRVQVGEAVNFRAQGNSPDGRPLTYQWSTTGGSVIGTGPNVRLDTAGAQPGTVAVRVRAMDDRNLSAEASQSITVEAPPPPPPPPQTVMLDQCQFALNSARVDNVCKAKLDSVALRMQSEPDATLAIVGFADNAERNPQPLAQARADNVRVYLSQDKGIAAALLTTRT